MVFVLAEKLSINSGKVGTQPRSIYYVPIISFPKRVRGIIIHYMSLVELEFEKFSSVK